MRTSIVGLLLIGVLLAIYWLGSNHANVDVSEAPRDPTPKTDTAPKSENSPSRIRQTDHTTEAQQPVYASEKFLTQLNQPYAFGIDPTSSRLIWTSAGDETFKTANTDGTDIRVILTNFEDPYELRIDSSFGHTQLFVSGGKVLRRSVDLQAGTHTDAVLLTLTEEASHGLGYDETSNTLYLGDHLGRPRFAISLDQQQQTAIKTITLLTHSTQEEP